VERLCLSCREEKGGGEAVSEVAFLHGTRVTLTRGGGEGDLGVRRGAKSNILGEGFLHQEKNERLRERGSCDPLCISKTTLLSP